MTKLLEEAIRKASELPPEAQDHLGALLLNELEADRAWDTVLGSEKSIGFLDAIAIEVMADYEAGETHPLDPENM